MKKTAGVVLAFCLAVGLGCNKSTPGGGDSSKNETNKSNNPLKTPAGEFTLKAPDAVLGTTIKQGEQQKKDIGISRGEGFDQDVKLTFEGLPQGTEVDPKEPVLKAGETKVQVTLKSKEDAAVTKAKVKIIGESTKGGSPGTTEWTINVKQK